MSTLSRFMNGFLNFDQVALGRLVLDTANPCRNFCKTGTLQLNEADRSRNEFANVYSLTNARSSSNFQVALTKLLDVFARKLGTSADAVQTDKAVSYELLNVDDKLETLLKDEAVQKWVETYKKKSRVYMVVALHAVQDISVSLDHDTTAAVGVKATVPVSTAAQAIAPGSTTVFPGGAAISEAVNPKVAVNHLVEFSRSASFAAPGERIIAVGYLEVKLWSFFSNQTEEMPKLAKKTVWKSFDASRAAEAADMIEATVLRIKSTDLGKGPQVIAESAGLAGQFVIVEGQI
ncbi:hypothetical protein BDV36DRAFT_264911 [Aspergillus pseudocaelatus]|uniref:Uncharacterized protein n=1 Tax=Aspergillus pseudocaelatus TaxID=1825620 RepID=A0ABQ6WBY0_9EURO|nr:hypothetical protein BDV36DRAFT_264911 [Aspergillus pseudocaelatus]